MTYPWQDLSPGDSYRLAHQQALSPLDQEVLLKLYLPIIGSHALSLYQVLNVDDQKPKRHSLLLTLLNMGIKEFYQARIRLEGIALLKTYKDEADNYLYLVQKPVSPAEFFSDSVLSMTYQDLVGDPIFQAMQDHFLEEKQVGQAYQDLSKSFLDVYHFQPKLDRGGVKANQPQTDMEEAQTPEVHNPDFDWDFFIQALSSSFVDRESVVAKPAKKAILYLNKAYGISELDMVKLVIAACDIQTGKLNVESLQGLARESHASKRAHLTDKTQIQTDLGQEDKSKSQTKEGDLTGFSKEDSELIAASKNYHPMAFMESIKDQKGHAISQSERKILENLQNQVGLSDAVINILIHYVLVAQSNARLQEDYVFTIANNWVNEKIDSPELAIRKVRTLKEESRARQEAYQQKSKRKFQKSVRQEIKPQWTEKAKDYQVDQELDPQVQASLKRRLEETRKKMEGRWPVWKPWT